MVNDEGKYSPLRAFFGASRNVGMDAHFFHPAIPGPYPLIPPQEQEVVDTYYVVDCGREVGIFTDKYVNFMFDPIQSHHSPAQPLPTPSLAFLTDTKSKSELGTMLQHTTIHSMPMASLPAFEFSLPVWPYVHEINVLFDIVTFRNEGLNDIIPVSVRPGLCVGARKVNN